MLSNLATYVNVEQAFSFGRDYVSEKRHRLSLVSISRGMSVVFQLKKQIDPPSLLRKWKDGLHNEKKDKLKRKGKDQCDNASWFFITIHYLKTDQVL